MVGQEPVDIESEFYAAGCPVSDSYKRYFHKDKENGCQMYLHSNGICFMTLAPSHPIIKEKLIIKSVVFPDQRLNNEVSGKRKRGGQFLQSQSILCTVTTDCGKIFTIRAGADGKLIEINLDLNIQPEKIKNPNEGLIAVLQTKLANLKTFPTGDWISEDEYLKSEIEFTPAVKTTTS